MRRGTGRQFVVGAFFTLIGVVLVAATGCGLSKRVDLARKLDLEDTVEINVGSWADWIPGKGAMRADLVITESDRVNRVLRDLRSAVRGRSAKWDSVGTCSFRRRRGDVVRGAIYARPTPSGEILILKVGRGFRERFYEFGGQLLKSIKEHKGGTVLGYTRPVP